MLRTGPSQYWERVDPDEKSSEELSGAEQRRFTVPDEVEPGWYLVCQDATIKDHLCTTIEVVDSE